jgi:hypothetical protein
MARQVRIHFEGNLTSHAYDEALAVRIYTRIVHDYSPRLARFFLEGFFVTKTETRVSPSHFS